MASTHVVTALPVPESSLVTRVAEKHFYQAMPLLIAGVVLYGFSYTIDRKLIHANPRPPILLWVHVFVFSAWLGFFILQSALVRIRKVKLHRTLGWAGAALGTSMVVIGFWVAVVMARFDTIRLHRANRDAFLIIPLFDIVAFAFLFALAVLWRARPERHRRLMLVATCALTGAAFGRIPMMHTPLGFYGGIDGLIVLGVFRDLVVNRRIHAVYAVSIPLLAAGQVTVSEVFLHRAGFWMRVAHGLLG